MRLIADQSDRAAEILLAQRLHGLCGGCTGTDDDQMLCHQYAVFLNETREILTRNNGRLDESKRKWSERFGLVEFGGPEVLQYTQTDVGDPKPGEARIAHTAIGLNFIDAYYRTGLYPLTLPSGLGSEGAGVVMSIGPGVEHVKPGDRVAYTSPAAARVRTRRSACSMRVGSCPCRSESGTTPARR